MTLEYGDGLSVPTRGYVACDKEATSGAHDALANADAAAEYAALPQWERECTTREQAVAAEYAALRASEGADVITGERA